MIKLRSITMNPLQIPFLQAFTHASAKRATTEAILVRAESVRGLVGVGEGCPRRYVTGESVASAEDFFSRYHAEWMRLSSLEELRGWVASHAHEIDRHPAAWCAVELACLDVFGQETEQPIEVLLGGQCLAGPFQYTAVLGAEHPAVFGQQLREYLSAGFVDFKLKVTGDFQADRQRVEALNGSAGHALRVRLDANNCWQDPTEASEYLHRLGGSFAAVEEPLRAGDYEGCRLLYTQCNLPIILDESFCRLEQFRLIHDSPSQWIVNVRVSKMGGLMRALAVAGQARASGIPVIVGAQVGETSILTRAGLAVAERYRDIVRAQEGAFGTHLLAYDLCEPPLMFGYAGRLAVDSYATRPGLGLTVRMPQIDQISRK